MSAGTLGLEQANVPSHPTMRAGYTRISAGTLQRLVAAIAAEAFEVPRRDVHAGVLDEQGQVSVQLALPLVLDVARWAHPRGSGDLSGNDGGTVFDRAASARAVIGRRIQALSGSAVHRVDVRFTGIHEEFPRTSGRPQ